MKPSAAFMYLSLIYLKCSPSAMVVVTAPLLSIIQFKRWDPETKYASGLKDMLVAQLMALQPVLL